MRLLFPLPISLVAIVLMMFSLAAMSAGLDARLDRNTVVEGETVVLLLSAPGDSAGGPDLSPLAQDFNLLGQSQSSRFQMINGRTSSAREWQVVLAPKGTGKLRVPALRLGNAVSNPIDLEVLPAEQAARRGTPLPVRLEIEATPDSPYVQGKVNYTVRLLTSVPLRRAGISDPVASDAIVERLGEERQYDTQRDGRRYQVIERRYAIFPQRSGTLTIEPPVLSAQVAQPSNRAGSLRDRIFGGADPFAGMGSMFDEVRPLQLSGHRVTLEVRPQPAGASSPWLPAESLTLNEAWSPNPPTFRVGEPVTRTLVITAQGVTGAQLPDIAVDAVSGINTYPDKALVETRADGDTLLSQKVIKVALVPEASGDYLLPAIDLPWWDTTIGEQRIAQLPAREITVLPAAAGASPRPQPPAADAKTNADTRPDQSRVGPQAAPRKTDAGDAAPSLWSGAVGYWPYLALLFAAAWLLTLVLWWRGRSNRTAVVARHPDPPGPVQPVARLLADFEQACRANDAATARRALLAWAAARWPDDPPRRLEQVAHRLGPDATPLVRELDSRLYADRAQAWDGTDAWQRFAPLLKSAARDSAAGPAPLPPLYPQDV